MKPITKTFLTTLLAIAVTSSGLGLAKSAPGALHALWSTPLRPGFEYLLVTPDSKVAIVAQPGLTEAFDASDGRRLWKRTDLAPSQALSSELFAGTTKGELVAMDPYTGSQKWASRLGRFDRLSLGANGRHVVAVLQTGDSTLPDARMITFSSKDGRRLWSRHASPSVGPETTIAFGENLGVASYARMGEPFVETVEGFDLQTGRRRFSDDGVRYEGWLVNNAWLARIDPAAPPTYDRYDSSGSRKVTYAYRPEPERNADALHGQNAIATVLTNQWVWMSINGRLYRYATNNPPSEQAPAVYDVRGTLVGAIGNSPLVVDGKTATFLTPDDTGKYIQRTIDVSDAIPDPFNVNDAVPDVPREMATSATIAYFAGNQRDRLFAVNAAGRSVVDSAGACPQPGIVRIISPRASIALCRDRLVRFSVAP